MLRILSLMLGLMFCAVAPAQVADSPPPPYSPAIAAAPARFSQEELDRLLAPIALYPDALLAQILMACTYPLEVVQADRWTRANAGLAGEQLQEALLQQNWDPSVKGLVSVPQVLAMMDERLDWTQQLGDAFLAQEGDVMDTVQRLRARAQSAGSLDSTPQQTVVNAGGAISIEPVNPDLLYVPVYNPMLVYGSWWWPAAPYYWYPAGYVVAEPFLYFGTGFIVGASIWGICDWGHRNVIIDSGRYDAFNRTRIGSVQWTHDAEHRRGVPYRDEATRRRFGRELPGTDARREFRGYEQPVAPYSPPTAPVVGQVPRAPAPPGAQVPQGRALIAPMPPGAGTPTPPAFESFGRGDAAHSYSNRGAASRAIESGPRGGGPRGGFAPAAPSRGAATPRRR